MLFEEQLARKPNLYPWSQDFIDSMWKTFWTPNEFSFIGDKKQYLGDLTEQERQIMNRTLSAIGQVEIAVKKFWAQLGDNLPHPSLSDLGYVMANSEVIHNMAYEKLLNVLGLNSIFEDNLKVPVVRDRMEYLRKHNAKVYDDDRKQYIYSIILFTLFVENVSLFSQFYIIMWFNRFDNVLKDTAQQVQYTRNEELLHAQVGIKIINTLREEYPELFDAELEAKIKEETKVAIEAEGRLIDWIIGDYKRPALSAGILKNYAQHRMNDSLQAIGFEQQFTVDPDLLNLTNWMEEEQFGNAMTDFFHKTPTEYAKHAKSYDEKDLF